MDLGMLELFTTNEKLQAIEECRKILEAEIKSSRDNYDQLRQEYTDLQQQLNEIVANEYKNRHIEVINNLNKGIKYETDRKLLYKKRSFDAEKLVAEKVEAIQKTEAEINNLNEVYNLLLESYNEAKDEINEFVQAAKEQSEKIVELGTQIEKETRINKGTL